MGGVNTGAERIYGGPTVNPGKPDHKIHYERINGRGQPLTVPEYTPELVPFAHGGDGAYTVAITNASVIYQLPFPGDEYIIVANGNTAYLRCGGAGTVATTAVGGYDFPIMDGVYFRCRPPFTHIAVIGPATAGALTFIHLRNP
jgi:hypothetical protein